MIEFTLSRVSVMICGMIMLAAITIPVSGMYDDMKDEDMRTMADNIAGTIDSFWDSDADVMFLRGWEIMPSSDCSVVLDGNHLTLVKNGCEYKSLISKKSNIFTISYNDTVDIERGEEGIMVSYQI